MKKSLPKLLLATSAGLLLAQYARAEDSGFYVTPKLNAIIARQDHVDYDVGGGITVAFGKYLDDEKTYQFEGEIGYLYADTSSDSRNDGHADFIPVLASFKINWAFSETMNFQFGPTAGFTFIDGPLDDAHFNFTYGGFAGLNFPMNDELNMEMGYRFLGTEDDNNMMVHDIYFGVSFLF